eukprot:TRINITY_DN437_c0_g1_i6.p1 TRINITY_DN437_c0_g1~~TRINITY_DN437_c0_g1_i6.p1  ORF type:complete len:370 (+),score=54.86 TRINITY_DN437_c0_g1_i6:60-1112(+)
MKNRRRVVWFLLFCFVVFLSLAEGKRRKKWGICGWFQKSCRQVITSLADRKDLPRLVIGTGEADWAELEQKDPNLAANTEVYRWPSASSRCSILSDVLFAASCDCCHSAHWMFYVMTGYNLAGNNLLNENQQGLLVHIPGTWDAVIAGFKRAIRQNENRAYHFTERGITKPYHCWVVLQTVKNGQSTFEVISSFANSYRVTDWLTKNRNLPVPNFAQLQMTAAMVEDILVTPLETLFQQCAENGKMNEVAKGAYKNLWGVEKWTNEQILELQLKIAYAPATPETCNTWKQNFMTQQRIPTDSFWNKAPTASNFLTRAAAEERIREFKEKNRRMTATVSRNGCEEDLEGLP